MVLCGVAVHRSRILKGDLGMLTIKDAGSLEGSIAENSSALRSGSSFSSSDLLSSYLSAFWLKIESIETTDVLVPDFGSC